MSDDDRCAFSQKRERLNRLDDDRAAKSTRGIGKQTENDGLRERSHRLGAEKIGKRTLVDLEARGHDVDHAKAVTSYVAQARSVLERLSVANAKKDARTSAAAATELRRLLDEAKRALAVVHNDAERLSSRSLVSELDRDAESALQAAFAPSIKAAVSDIPGHRNGTFEREAAVWAGRDESPTTIAERGIAGAGGALPFHDQIQASFGSHRIGNVTAHVGGDAADAARALGARAFAIGDTVAFADAPDLFTAAHEAAHVVQQRAGVSLKSIDGGAGDSHEQHADAVAAAVVAGHSAQALLDQVRPGGSGSRVVQRKTDAAPPTTSSAAAPVYVAEHIGPILVAVSDRIRTTGLPDPHPRIRWRESGVNAVGEAIAQYAEAAGRDVVLKRLMELAQPADLMAIVDDARRGPGGVDGVARAVAFAFDHPLVDSVLRMGMRLRAYLDAHGSAMPHAATDLVASCPIDGVIATVLIKSESVSADYHKASSNDTPGKPFAHGAREVNYVWMGSKDPNLWNWIHVTSPTNATVEDVAHTPLVGDHADSSEQAYRIVASPPYFGIPFETARLVPEALEHAPPDVKQKVATGPGPRVPDASALAQSALGDEAALAQAPAAKKEALPALRTLERSRTQMSFLSQSLFAWKADAPLAPAIAFLDRRSAEFTSDRKAATRWHDVLVAQAETLQACTDELTGILDDLAKRNVVPKAASSIPALPRTLGAYARAAGLSHLTAQGDAALVEARRQHALLPLSLADQQIALDGRGVRSEEGSSSAADDAMRHQSLSTRAADLRLAAAKGQAIDPDQVDQLSADAEELEMRTRLGSIEVQIADVMKAADAANYTTAEYQEGIPTIRALPRMLGSKLGLWRALLDHPDKAALTETHVPMTGPQHSRWRQRQTVQHVKNEMEAWKKESQIEQWIPHARQTIANEELGNKLNRLLIEIGIMVVTGEIANAAIDVVRGVMIAEEAIEAIRSAGLAYRAGEIAMQAGMATVAQGLTGGDVTGSGFVETALSFVLASAMLRPFAGLLTDSAAIETELAETAARATGGKATQAIKDVAKTSLAVGGVIAKYAVEVAGESIAGIASSAAAHAALHGQMSATSYDSLIEQGLAIASSRFVHQRTKTMHARLESHVRRGVKAEPLLGRVKALSDRSAAEKVTPIEALAMLAERRQLLLEERSLLGDQANAANEHELSELDAGFIDVPFRLAHLSAVVSGHIYEGTAAEIHAAIEGARKIIPDLKSARDANGTWRIDIGARHVEINELQPGGTRVNEANRGQALHAPTNNEHVPADSKPADDKWKVPKPPRTLHDDDPRLRETNQINTPERQALRKQIVENILARDGAHAKEHPTLYLMGGGGASGKGVVGDQLATSGALPDAGTVHIDPDEIKEMIPEYHSIAEDGDSRGAAVVHEESSEIAKRVRDAALDSRFDIVLDQTMGNEAKGLNLIAMARAKGYRIVMFGVTVDPVVAVERAAARAKTSGRYVPTKELLKAHKGFSDAFEAYAKEVDEATLYDTSKGGKQADVVARKEEGRRLDVITEQLYRQFIQKSRLDPSASGPGSLYAPDRKQYVEQAMANLNETSRTVKEGRFDTSASPDKAASMQDGADPSKVKAQFEQSIGELYDARNRPIKGPDDLRSFVEHIAGEINAGVTKQLIRTADSSKHPYTKVAELPAAMDAFYRELYTRLITPGEDPISLAAWVEYRINLTDHFFADGCGKISKAVSGWVLMRYGQDLPTYKGSIPKDRYPTKVRGSSDAVDAKQLGNWEEFYRGMFEGARVENKNAKAPQTVADEYRALPEDQQQMVDVARDGIEGATTMAKTEGAK